MVLSYVLGVCLQRRVALYNMIPRIPYPCCAVDHLFLFCPRFVLLGYRMCTLHTQKSVCQ